jgi:hypothetical protein
MLKFFSPPQRKRAKFCEGKKLYIIPEQKNPNKTLFKNEIHQ